MPACDSIGSAPVTPTRRCSGRTPCSSTSGRKRSGRQEGEVHEALHPLVIERNVLEWRFDPRSSARIPEASYDARVIVLCQEGYTSSLAADALQRLGISRATDVIGGFQAWQAANLPVACRRLTAGPIPHPRLPA